MRFDQLDWGHLSGVHHLGHLGKGESARHVGRCEISAYLRQYSLAASCQSFALSYGEARAIVIRELARRAPEPASETVSLERAVGRVLAAPLTADRDYPTLDRSARDGFAVRSADLPGRLRLVGEVRAGERYTGAVKKGEAVEIMTGAPVPEGADTIVMVEHVMVDEGLVTYDGIAPAGQFINLRGGESSAGETLLQKGVRIGAAEVGLLASCGQTEISVYVKPRIAILSTGDELVAPNKAPARHQIRNSNAYALSAQVESAGGTPEILGIARDQREETRGLIDRGLTSDLLLLSGGVSAGKYDVVELALASFDAQFFFDRVAIQPGQPLVFGQARNRFFFGLPGNLRPPWSPSPFSLGPRSKCWVGRRHASPNFWKPDLPSLSGTAPG